jgi:hypothetical protein
MLIRSASCSSRASPSRIKQKMRSFDATLRANGQDLFLFYLSLLL